MGPRRSKAAKDAAKDDAKAAKDAAKLVRAARKAARDAQDRGVLPDLDHPPSPPPNLPTEGQEDDTQDGPDTLVPPSAPSTLSKTPTRRRPSLKLTPDQFDQVCEYVEAHEALYSKGDPDWCKTGLKLGLWCEIASEAKVLEVDGTTIADGPRIKTWFESQRSVFGRVTKEISGQAPKVLSSHEKRILAKLHFLGPHVYRVPLRSGHDLDEELRAKHPSRFTTPSASQGRAPSESESDTQDELQQSLVAVVPPSTPSGSTPSGPTPSGSGSAKRRKVASASVSDIMNRLDVQMSQSTALAAQLAAGKEDDDERADFCRGLLKACHKLDEEGFESFQAGATTLINQYKKETRERSRAASVAAAQVVQEVGLGAVQSYRFSTTNVQDADGNYPNAIPLMDFIGQQQPASVTRRTMSAPDHLAVTDPTVLGFGSSLGLGPDDNILQ